MGEAKNISLILATELSKAYDLIDHKILLKKLEHHGIRKNSIDIIESFLKDRSYFVEIQGARSKPRKLKECLVVQGSKSGGFYFSVYCIEVMDLPIAMKSPNMFKEISDKDLKDTNDVEHKITQFLTTVRMSSGPIVKEN